jgi:hypothetical protein
MLNIEAAKKELAEKSLNDIQIETAWTWAGRACASYQNSLEAKGKDKLLYWSIGEEYYHESCEHAALVNSETFLKEVRDAMAPYQEEASEALGARFLGKDDVVESSENE